MTHVSTLVAHTDEHGVGETTRALDQSEGVRMFVRRQPQTVDNFTKWFMTAISDSSYYFPAAQCVNFFCRTHLPVCRVRDKENNKVILYNGVFKKFYSFYLQTSRGRAKDKKKGFLIVASLVNCAFIFISNCCEPPPAPWLIVLHLYLPYFFLLSVS